VWQDWSSEILVFEKKKKQYEIQMIYHAVVLPHRLEDETVDFFGSEAKAWRIKWFWQRC
jgi:hypothetical protein